MAENDDRWPTAFLLPWLDAPDESLSFGRVCVGSWALQPEGQVGGELDAVTKRYQTIGGLPVRGSIMWLTDRDPIAPLSADDLDDLDAHRMALAAATIAENEYFSGPSQPATSAHFDGYAQRIAPTITHVGLVSRRRDGTTTSTTRLDGVQWIAPQAATSRPTVRPKPELLAAFAA